MLATHSVNTVNVGIMDLDLIGLSETLAPLKAVKRSYLVDLLNRAEVQTVFAGDSLFEDAIVDHQHIYLLFGEVELQYSSGSVERVQAGDIQMPVAHQQPRPCRALACSDTTILRVDSDQLDRALAWSQISQYLMSEVSLQRDLDEDVHWMRTVLDSNLFHKVPPVNVEQIFSRLTPMVVHAGEVIVRQGEIGDCCYFIKDGDAEVAYYDATAKCQKKIVDISEGRCFGEDALVYEQARNANVTMSTDGVLMRLEKNDFLLLLREPSVDEVSERELSNLAEIPTLIDVRTDEEYLQGHLALSGNVPLNLLSIKKRLLSPEKMYVLYCDTGRRSRAAAFLLGKQGYNVMALEGGLAGQNMSDQLVQEVGYILRDGELVTGQ